jgi:hypothetical protein
MASLTVVTPPNCAALATPRPGFTRANQHRAASAARQSMVDQHENGRVGPGADTAPSHRR